MTTFKKSIMYWCGLVLVFLALTACFVWYANKAVMDAAAGRILQTEDVPQAEVALVFGARVSEDGDVSSPLEWRLETARSLYEKGLVRRILVSGDNRRPEYNEPLAMKNWLVNHGVPADAIACDYAGRRTLDTCARAARLWGIHDNVILVSQFYHLPRALFLAKAWGMNAVATPALHGAFRRDLVRESLARCRAWLDVHVLKTQPAVWGQREEWPGEEGSDPSRSIEKREHDD